MYGIVIGAWASNNKFSLLGAVRGSAQMISYEVAMGLSVIGVLMAYGTLELQEIARSQGTLIADLLPESWNVARLAIGWLPAWGIFLQPLAFLLFFVAAVAETKRMPFDLPEGESELVAGYHVEYSGGKFLMFFAGEFAEIVTASALITTLVLRRLAGAVFATRGIFLSLGRQLAFAPSRRGAVASGRVHAESHLLLLAANPFALDRAALSLRSSDAPGVEDAAAAGAGERADHGSGDFLFSGDFVNAMTGSEILFFILAGLLVFAALLVVFQRNVVHCAMALVAALFLIAILFLTLQAPMVGVLQILVYAGAIMVLFLFVIMFLNPTASEARRGLWRSFGAIMALLLAGALVAVSYQRQSTGGPGGSHGAVRQPGDPGPESIYRVRSTVRDRLGAVAGGHGWRGGFRQEGALDDAWCRLAIISSSAR